MRFRDFLFGLLLGASAGLLLAPANGRRNRAMIKDKAVKYSHDAGGYVDKKSRHLANKAKGYTHDIKEYVSNLKSRQKEEMVEEEQPAST